MRGGGEVCGFAQRVCGLHSVSVFATLRCPTTFDVMWLCSFLFACRITWASEGLIPTMNGMECLKKGKTCVRVRPKIDTQKV